MPFLLKAFTKGNTQQLLKKLQSTNQQNKQEILANAHETRESL